MPDARTAAAQGEEYAVPLDIGLQWDVGAPMPQLLSSGLRSFVAFYLQATHADSPELVGSAEFTRCLALKLGPPNDEVLAGHPLYERGLEGYGAYVVENSRWLRGLVERQRHSSHAEFDPRTWEPLRHYFFLFHDETVEAIAEGVEVETFPETTTMRAVLARTVEQLG